MPDVKSGAPSLTPIQASHHAHFTEIGILILLKLAMRDNRQFAIKETKERKVYKLSALASQPCGDLLRSTLENLKRVYARTPERRQALSPLRGSMFIESR
jgi:hypothetical protein